MKLTSNHYTFGESDLAAQRLALLAAAYDRPGRDFLARWGTPNAFHAIDLGCGPGHTTRLVQSMLRPQRTTGLDASERLLDQAKLNVSQATFIRHDITQTPFPCPPADFFYCRFLLTHLSDPGFALRVWAKAARPRAHLLIQETAALESDDPIFQRYYRLVAALQSGYGQSLTIGATLDRHVSENGWALIHSEIHVVEQAPHIMARLHAMNIRTWGRDTKARRDFDRNEIAQVQAGLDRIAAGKRKTSPV